MKAKRITIAYVVLFLLISLFLASCAKEETTLMEEEGVENLSDVTEVRVAGSADEIRSFQPAGSMRVEWSEGGEEGTVFPQQLGEENNLTSRVGIERYVPDGRDNVYLIDHPPVDKGTRVQKFAFPSGKLLFTEYLAASTLFKSDGQGKFLYLHPAGIKGSEGLVVIEKDNGTVEATLTVPRGMAAGEIFLVEDEVYLLDEEYGVPKIMSEKRTASYFPLLLGLKSGKRVEANYLGWDNNFYFFGTREVDALTAKPLEGKRFLFGPIKEGKPDKKIVFPWEVSLVGVDEDGFIYVVRERSLGFSLDSDNRSEWSTVPRFLYRVSPNGEITHSLLLSAWFEPGMLKKFYVWVGRKGDVWQLVEDGAGLEIRRFIRL